MLKKVTKMCNATASYEWNVSLAIFKFDISDDSGFPLNPMYAELSSPTEADKYVSICNIIG